MSIHIPAQAAYLDSLDPSTCKARITRSGWEYASSQMIALVAEAEGERVPVLQAACRELGVSVVGGVFPELIVDGQIKRTGAVLLRSSNPFSYAIARGPDKFEQNLSAAIGQILEKTRGNHNNTTLFMLCDSLQPSTSSLLDRLFHRLADRVSYMGASAGSETFKPVPCLFDNAAFIESGVILVLLSDIGDPAVEHGYSLPGRMITATSTLRNKVRTINWRPAFDVYQELIFSRFGLEVTRATFYQHAVHYPLGIIRMTGEVLVRIPVELADDGALRCIGEVPANSVLALLGPDELRSNRAVERLARGVGKPTTDVVLLFYCAGRKLQLGEQAISELQEIASALKPSKLYGALSLGEMASAPQHGYPLFHNAAILACSWGKA